MNTHSLDLELSSSQYAYITDANQTGLDITGDFTIEAWIKLESIDLAQTIVGKYNRNSKRQYRFGLDGITNKLLIAVSDDGTTTGGHFIQFIGSTAFDGDDLNTWIHVAGSFDISEETTKFYINGVEENGTIQVGTSIGDTLNNSDAIFQIGAGIGTDGSTVEYPFDGLLDEVRVWSDIRSEAEIQTNYQRELAGNEDNLVAYWKLNNNYLDETTNDNDLTASGSPVFSDNVPFADTTTTSTSTSTSTTTTTSTSTTTTSTSTTTTSTSTTTTSTSTSTSSSTSTSTSITTTSTTHPFEFIIESIDYIGKIEII